MWLITKIFCILLVFHGTLCLTPLDPVPHSFNGLFTPRVIQVAIYNCKGRDSVICKLSNIYFEEDQAFRPGSKQISTLDTLKITDSNIPVLNMQYVCQIAYNLLAIDFENIGIKEISKGAFNGCNLSSINLSNNKIKELSADTFGQNRWLSSIYRINLSGNQLKSLPTDIFKGLVWLEELYLSSNEITSLDNVDFIQNYYLRVLYLSHNPLKSINLNLAFQYLHQLGIQDTDIPCDKLKETMKELKQNNVNLDTENNIPRTRDYEPNLVDGIVCLSTKQIIFESFPSVMEDMQKKLTLLSGVSVRLDNLEEKIEEMLELKERVNHLEENVEHLKPSSTEPSIKIEEPTEEKKSYHESDEYSIIYDQF